MSVLSLLNEGQADIQGPKKECLKKGIYHFFEVTQSRESSTGLSVLFFQSKHILAFFDNSVYAFLYRNSVIVSS